MGSLKESDIELAVCKWAELAGWLCPKLQWVNQTGWPDRCFIKKGMVIFIEFKKPGGVVSKKQKYWIEKLHEQGIPAFTCDSMLEAQIFLASFENE